MSRGWYGVNVRGLCGPEENSHLLGEHGEAHQELGSILAGRLGGVEGHIRDGQVYPALMLGRHARLAAELRRRGYNHTPGHRGGEYATFSAAVDAARREHPRVFEVLPVDYRALRERNRRDLADRCAYCRPFL